MTEPEERWLVWLPYAMLAVATVVATPLAPALGQAAVDVRWTLALTSFTALWMGVFRAPSPAHYWGRVTLAFALTWLNPLYAIFAFTGFLDAHESMPGRRWAPYAGLLVVAVTQAGAQSGGLPPRETTQWLVFLALIGVNAALASAFTVIALRSDQRSTELARLNAELRELQATVAAQARAAGVQEERQRLARELHDTLAQSLAGIVTQLQAGAEPEKVTGLARAALAEARRSVHGLSPGPLDHRSLCEALERIVAEWGAAHDVKADLVVEGEPNPLHPEVEATAVRIVQESLTNVAKHASAARVGVTLTYDDDELLLDVRDDGVGFDPAAAPGAGSFGLRGMRQRAERLAGALEVESEPTQGATVTARLPAVRPGAA